MDNHHHNGKGPITTTVVIPALNEEEGIAVVLRKLYRVIDDSYEIIVVDDGSTDRTAEVARQFTCDVIQHEVNKGKGEALKTGIRHAQGNAVLWLDADDTYPVEPIPQMAAALQDGYDLVYASRGGGRKAIPRFNRIGNALFSWSVRAFYGFQGNDPCTGLGGVRKEHLTRMDLTGQRFTIDSEIALKAGRMHLRVLDIPIEYRQRIGQAKLSGVGDGLRIAITILGHLLWRPNPSMDPEVGGND